MTEKATQIHAPASGRGGRVEEKVILISGAAQGMGASHARLLVEEGARVVIGDIADDLGRALAEELGDHARFVHLDVTQADDWQVAVDVAVSEFGGLDGFVSNAGIINFGSIEDYSLEAWNQVIAVNLTGTFLGLKATIPELKKSANGSIVIISSNTGLLGYASLPGYSTTKFGLRGLTKTVAVDLAPYGIRVNSVHPGLITTPMTEGLAQAEFGILRRAGRPIEVSNLILYLASDESSYSTGAEFVVDGGATSAGATSWS